MQWIILAVLFLARTIMACQYQSVAALSPFMMDSLAITLTDIGVLIGLYLGPGIIIAVAGGVVATWFGDKRTVIASLGLMIVGGMMVAQATTLEMAMAGRVLSGAGGVVINVLMTKMVLDWFAGRNVATAIAIFISSWPFGIALALVVLPPLAASADLAIAWTVMTGIVVSILVLFTLVYRAPDGAAAGSAPLRFGTLPWVPLACAALLWALYNAAFAMMFGFGHLVLIDQGFAVAQAGSAISLYILALMIGIPLGGWLADRTGRGSLIILASLLTGAALFPTFSYLPAVWIAPILVLAGLVVGLAPGPVVAMPGIILSPEERAFGTGAFYSIYYLLMMSAPAFAGAAADRMDNVTVALVLGSAMMLLGIPALVAFNRTAVPAAIRP